MASTSVEQSTELGLAEPSLCEDVVEQAAAERLAAVNGHHDRSASVRMPEDDVAAALARNLPARASARTTSEPVTAGSRPAIAAHHSSHFE
jgi:hypothetical protein